MKRATIPTATLLQKLRELDPIAGDRSVTADRLHEIRGQIVSTDPDEPMPTLLRPPATGGPTARAGWWRPVLAMAILVPVAVVVGLTWYPRSGGGSDSLPVSGLAAAPAIPAAYQQIASRYAPQTQHLTVDCGGQVLPVALLAAPGGAENGTGPAADALRALFRDNPFAGMGTVTPTNWVLLAETGTRAIFGQRTGPIGVGTVLVFNRHGNHFTPSGESGCSTVRTGPTTTAEPIIAATSSGMTLKLQWQNSTNCGDGPAHTARVVDRVEVLESSTTVRILLTSRPAPDAGSTHGACAATGVTATATAQLTAPLGHRQLLDDARLPANSIAAS